MKSVIARCTNRDCMYSSFILDFRKGSTCSKCGSRLEIIAEEEQERQLDAVKEYVRRGQ